MSVSFPPIGGSSPLPPATDPFGTQGPPAVPPSLSVSDEVLAMAQALPFISSAPQLPLSDYYKTVSEAQLRQKIQDVINAINDPLATKDLLQLSEDQAQQLRNLITAAYQYQALQNQLDALDLAAKETALNQAIDAYNLKIGGSSGDTAHTTQLNGLIDAYNQAQTSYNSALLTYQTALAAYSSAQTSYAPALDTWNTALAQYKAGQIDATALEQARTVFNAAQASFTSAQTTFNAAQNTFNGVEQTWLTAQTNLNTGISVYNTYAAGRQQDLANLNQVIQTWNAAVTASLPIITAMNQIRINSLNQTALPYPPSFSTNVTYPSFTLPTPGSNSLRDQVEGYVDQVNTNVGTLVPPHRHQWRHSGH